MKTRLIATLLSPVKGNAIFSVIRRREDGTEIRHFYHAKTKERARHYEEHHLKLMNLIFERYLREEWSDEY